MKRVAFLINSLAGGGAERVLLNIVNALKGDFKITLILMEDVIYYELPENVEIITLSKSRLSEKSLNKFINLGIFALRFAKVCKKINVDVAFSLTTRPNLINALSKYFNKNVKSVIYEVSTPSVQYNEDKISIRLIRMMIKSLYPKADKIIGNSIGVSQDLQDNFILRKEIDTIYSPIDIEYIRLLSKEKKSFGCKGVKKFITIGRLDSGKNHAMMIDAFSKIKDEKAKLYILGEGILKDQLRKKVKLLNMENRIEFLGFDSNPFKHLSQSDVFLFSSNFEGFPSVLIEALSCEIPIISTDCFSGPREILSNIKYSNNKDIEIGEYGILTEVNNEKQFVKAIDLLNEDNELYESYKSKSLNRARHFSKEISISKLKKLIQEI